MDLDHRATGCSTSEINARARSLFCMFCFFIAINFDAFGAWYVFISHAAGPSRAHGIVDIRPGIQLNTARSVGFYEQQERRQQRQQQVTTATATAFCGVLFLPGCIRLSDRASVVWKPGLSRLFLWDMSRSNWVPCRLGLGGDTVHMTGWSLKEPRDGGFNKRYNLADVLKKNFSLKLKMCWGPLIGVLWQLKSKLNNEP